MLIIIGKIILTALCLGALVVLGYYAFIGLECLIIEQDPMGLIGCAVFGGAMALVIFLGFAIWGIYI